MAEEALVGRDSDPRPLDLALPGPSGAWHVRIKNRGNRPLLLPAGEALLSPSGPSRTIDRPVWIEAHAATFVPVVQTIPLKSVPDRR